MKYAACLIVLMTLAANLHAENIKSKRAPAKVPARSKATLLKARPVGPLDYLKPTQQWLHRINPNRTYTLEQLRDLKSLSLQLYTQQTAQLITDANMIYVEPLKNLESLRVHRLIGDAGVAHFAGLKKLTLLNMPNCRITDAGMVYLKDMTRMRNLVVCATNISDRSMPYIKAMQDLELLNLERTQITDAGLEHLKNHTNLKKLFLSFTDISDRCVPLLKTFTRLDTLYLQGTKISSQGIAQLRASLPGCNIVH
jgi:hypothetical protein